MRTSQNRGQVRAAKTEQTGGIGSNEVSANFERIGWGPVPNRDHDLGTDLLVAARDERLFDRGLIVGVQVKAGPSYFKEEQRAADGELTGWWYYERDARHFDDWVMHGLPHLLVLHDLESRRSYWVHVTTTSVTSTGLGAKVLVPVKQEVNQANLGALLAVAATGRAPIELQGSAWTAGAGAVAPARRLRHALLVPRLVAPHRNAGLDRPIEPEEALALVAQARLRDYEQFSTEHAAVPSAKAAQASRDWRWRLVGALAQSLLGEDRGAVRELVGSAPTSSARAAVAVVAAAMLIEDGDPGSAADMLTEVCIAPDDLGPVDLGWVLVQRARARAEIGDGEGAREDSVASRRAVAGDAADPTASVIAGSAAMLLFRSAAWSEADVGDVVSATDTAGFWWRTQSIAGGAVAAIDRQFKTWADDRSVTFWAEDPVNNSLVSAALNANLAADHSAWCSTLSTLGRLILLTAPGRDVDRLDSGLTELRRAGDTKAVELTATHVWRDGPLEILSRALSDADPSTLSRTTARATLALWEKAGDCASADSAARAADFLLEVLTDPTPFVARVSPQFLVRPAAADALAGVALAAGASHPSIVSYLAGLEEVGDELLAMGLVRVASRLPTGSVAEGDRVALHSVAVSQPNPRLAAALLNLAGGSESMAELVRRVEAGDGDALAGLNVTLLSPAVASSLIDRFSESVRQTHLNAERGVYVGPSMDPAEALVVLNASFPPQARWEPVLELLASVAVPGNYKRGAVTKVIGCRESIPLPIRQDLLAVATAGIADPDPHGGFFGGVALAGAVEMLRVALGDVGVVDEMLARLLGGSVQQRADAAQLLGWSGRSQDQGALAVLASDPEAGVRESAAWAAGHLFALRAESDQLLTEVVHRLAVDSGAAAPRALLGGFLSVPERSGASVAVARSLIQHGSAAVRHTALNIAVS